MKANLVLAAFLLAGTAAFAQSEQWLQYHTTSDSRWYHGVEFSTNAPAGVALPKLNGKAYFARWITPMDPSGGRWLCLDHSRSKSGPCDRLYIDTKGDGRLDDKAPVQAKIQSYNANFPPVALTFKGEDGPITYHLIFEFYQNETSTQLYASSGGWYEGQVSFDGVKKRVQLIDGNVNGTFNDWKEDPYESDRVTVSGDKAGERFLGKLLEVGGKFYRIEAARDGAFVKIQKAEDVTLGKAQVPTNITEFAAFGENGHFIRKPSGGEFTLPVGNYRMIHWSIDRKDDKGAEWTMSGRSFPKEAKFAVATDCPATLDIGEPIRAELESRASGRQITFNLKFIGKQNESVDIMRGNQRPPGPKLMLADATGKLCYTNTFEFG